MYNKVTVLSKEEKVLLRRVNKALWRARREDRKREKIHEPQSSYDQRTRQIVREEIIRARQESEKGDKNDV